MNQHVILNKLIASWKIILYHINVRKPGALNKSTVCIFLILKVFHIDSSMAHDKSAF